jgi:putative DNA primase/helicase
LVDKIQRTDRGVGNAMPTLVDFFRQYLPIRFGGGTGAVIADENRATPDQSFQPVGLQDFLALQVQPREMLLAPILPERSLAMLYAPRGIGKSWLGLTIGLAVASGGSVLRWSAPKPHRVLLVDGEMVLCDLQTRLNLILAGVDTKIPNDGFRVLAADHTERGINLSSGEGQQELERHLDGIDLLILDNLSTLLASGSEGASDAWLPMQNWLLKLRRRGVAVLLIHHAGVNGRQRGTSRREDALDTVIALRRPLDYSPQEGARFEVHIEKARSLVGDGAVPFEAAVESFTTEAGKSAIRWMARDLKPSVFEQAAVLFQEGKTVRQVKTLLGISHGEAGRLRLRAAAERLLEPGREDDGEKAETADDGPYMLN